MVWKFGESVCDVVGCDQNGVKKLTLRNTGFLGAVPGDRFDLCWKHYLENLQQFKEVTESMKK